MVIFDDKHLIGMSTIAVIGSGIGGLAVAIRLRAKGFGVHLFEKEGRPGGKVMELRRDGFRFDLGPSLLTQPERLEELFRLSGEDPADHFRYHRLDSVCRYFWPDGSTLEVPDDPARFAGEVGQLTGAGSSEVLKYLREAGHLYETAAPLFIERPFPTWEALTSSQGKKIGRNPLLLDPFRSLHGRNSRSFSDPRVVQLFDRYATYNGSNPYQAPATLKMIAHLEHALGAFFPEEGIYSIARELAVLATRHGVVLHLDSPVEKILIAPGGKTVTGIRVNGENLQFDGVVSDVDVNTLYHSGMIGIRRPLAGRRQQLSSSALIFYWGVKGIHP
ncbi:MAG: FAD-dependent oxidoreductase, partial [Bacteroidales bacterium]